VLDVDAVRGTDEERVARGGDGTGGHIVWRDAEVLHHVERPNDFGLVVGVACGIEAADFAAAGDEPEAVAFDERGAAEAFHRPVVDAAGRELFAAMLPKELAVLDVEAEEDAEVDLVAGITLEPAAGVVGADIDM